MVTDKEITRQILERDILNLYRTLPQITKQFGINIAPILVLFEDKIFQYIDSGLDTVMDALFGEDSKGDIDEATDIAKMMVNDKIEEYRQKVRKAKINTENNSIT